MKTLASLLCAAAVIALAVVYWPFGADPDPDPAPGPGTGSKRSDAQGANPAGDVPLSQGGRSQPVDPIAPTPGGVPPVIITGEGKPRPAGMPGPAPFGPDGDYAPPDIPADGWVASRPGEGLRALQAAKGSGTRYGAVVADYNAAFEAYRKEVRAGLSDAEWEEFCRVSPVHRIDPQSGMFVHIDHQGRETPVQARSGR